MGDKILRVGLAVFALWIAATAWLAFDGRDRSVLPVRRAEAAAAPVAAAAAETGPITAVDDLDTFAQLWADTLEPQKPGLVRVSKQLGSSGEPIVVNLTFDDGPGPETEGFLDLLAEYRIPATFFVNGSRIPSRAETTRRIVLDGHAIANHTQTHCSLQDIYHLVPEELCAGRTADREIADTQRVVEEVTGVAPTCFRPPFGAQSSATKQLVGSYGLTTWIWDLDTEDWQLGIEKFHHDESDVITILDSIPEYAAAHNTDRVVVLAHDGAAASAVTLEIFRTWLETNADRYVFESLKGC